MMNMCYIRLHYSGLADCFMASGPQAGRRPELASQTEGRKNFAVLRQRPWWCWQRRPEEEAQSRLEGLKAQAQLEGLD